jgi:hypothetical protein
MSISDIYNSAQLRTIQHSSAGKFMLYCAPKILVILLQNQQKATLHPCISAGCNSVAAESGRDP